MNGKVMEHCNRGCAVDGAYQKVVKDIKHILERTFTVSEIFAFQMFYLENLGQDREIHDRTTFAMMPLIPMTNINFIKSHN